MLCEEQLEGVQFLRNALDVVQSVDANNHLDAAEPRLELSYPCFDRFALQILYEQSGVNELRG
jgi:hypothetical protein